MGLEYLHSRRFNQILHWKSIWSCSVRWKFHISSAGTWYLLLSNWFENDWKEYLILEVSTAPWTATVSRTDCRHWIDARFRATCWISSCQASKWNKTLQWSQWDWRRQIQESIVSQDMASMSKRMDAWTRSQALNQGKASMCSEAVKLRSGFEVEERMKTTIEHADDMERIR